MRARGVDSRNLRPDTRRNSTAPPRTTFRKSLLCRGLPYTRSRIPGKSDLAKAFRYGLSRQEAFSLFLTDGRVAIDNNPAERALRPIGIGRKNWLFAGADTGAETLARAMTVIETAKLNGLDPQAYLADILDRIHDHKINRLNEVAVELGDATHRDGQSGRTSCGITGVVTIKCVLGADLRSLSEPAERLCPDPDAPSRGRAHRLTRPRRVHRYRTRPWERAP